MDDGTDDGTREGDRPGRRGVAGLEFVIALPFLLIAAAGLVFSLVDLVFQLIVLPFALLSRLVRLTGWPVQLDRADKYIRTDRVKGFGRAGAHRDEQVALVGAGQVTAPAA